MIYYELLRKGMKHLSHIRGDFMKNNNISITNEMFKPLDFFMIRTPIFPIEFYNKAFSNTSEANNNIDKLMCISQDPIVRETIAVASLDLLLSLNKLNNTISSKEKEKILSSLLKYLIRMSTRTTPFGLFSGVTAGNFADETNIKLKDISMYKKRARPDAEWLFKVINTLEKKDYILKDLIVTWNSIARFNGSRIELPYLSTYVQECNENLSNDDSVSIRAAKAVQYVAEKSLNGIRYEDLLDLLTKKYPDTEAARIENLLSELLKKEFIITNLRPPLDIHDTYAYMLKILKNIELAKTDFNALNDIYQMIDNYNKLPIGRGEKSYLGIIEKMKNIEENKNYLQVDLNLAEDDMKLNSCIAKDLTEVAGILCILSSQYNNPENIDQYRNEFIGKYGEEREVPVLELIDLDKGLGFPADYTVPFSNKQLYRTELNKNTLKLQESLLCKVIKAINNKENAVSITDEDIEQVSIENLDFKNIPKSLELNVYVKANSQEDIDNGNYELFLGPNIGSDSAGKTFGRFSDILSKQVNNKINEINELEKKELGEDKVFAQLIFAPNKGSIGNICLSPNVRDYEIIVSTSPSIEREKIISLQDLVIGVSQGRFYLKSTLLNKEVIVTTNHMLNRGVMPNICRFLLDVSEDGKIDWFPIKLFNSISNFPYIPRIKINNVTIAHRSWNINENLLDIKLKNISEEMFFNAINKWRMEWNVPNIVYQVEADNRLMFNLDNKLHLNELLNILKKKKSLRITDVECDINDFWIHNPRGNYVSEIVVPFVKNNIMLKEYNENNLSKTKKQSINISTLDDKRTIFPGNEWLFLKLYGNYTREEELIAFEINTICKELIEAKYIDEFFFMRYSDPDHHIRLRFKGNPEKLYTKVLPILSRWFKSLKNDGLLSTIEIDTYVREIERYGGVAAIDYAEKVFFYDSMVVLNILLLKRLNKINIDIDEIALCSVISYLEDFNISYLNQIKLLDLIIKPSENRKNFQEHRNRYMFIGNSDNNWGNLRSTEEGMQLYNILRLRSAAIKEYTTKLEELAKSNDLTNNLENIILSVIHLHCNRLFGTDREKEREILSFVRHTLYALKYFKTKRPIDNVSVAK